jgi:phage/plasmid-associated DNA primase
MVTENSRINEFLACLGYSEGEKVFIRTIHTDKNVKAKKITLTYPISNLPRQQSGWGMYFVVNGQGDKKKEITHAKALFCEFDHLSYDEQLTISDKFNLPYPTIQLYTGGKSIHHYWVFDQPVSIDQWQKLINDLIDYVGSDPAVKDPSRIMRLPDYIHYSKDKNGNLIEGKKSEIIGGTYQSYSYQQLRDAIPHCIPKEVKTIMQNNQVTDSQVIDLIKSVITPHQEGTNTYENYRQLLGAIKRLYGEDVALNIADIVGMNDDYNWEQIVKSTNGNFNLGTICYHLIELGFITKTEWANLFKSSQSKSFNLTVTGEQGQTQDDNTTNKNLINDSWVNIATNELFSGHWISLNGTLYQFNGNYYEEIEDGIIKQRINHWCANYIDEKGKKSKASPSSVKNLYEWVNQKFYVSPSQINCAGIPLKNGYLKLEINNGKPSFVLKQYSPEIYFTYQSEVKYDPSAKTESALKLLECLDEPYKSLFLKTISTVLGFKEIRRKWDRIKALLLIGDGSNGKDTLREIISLILGEQGISSCSLNDFSQSRGFNIARLATNPKINWSSENKEINIDSIQSLKQAITGDPLFIEGKGKDGFEIRLNSLFIFNSNHQPDLKGNQYAIQSRLTLIPFTKTYSMNPKNGELKADPRFKHDKDFLINEVAPAFLNLIISAYQEIYQHGIRYDQSEMYFTQIITDNNHIRQFVNDRNIQFTGDASDMIGIGETYGHLIQWYVENGYLDFEDTKSGKRKNLWLVDDRKDPTVKASKDLKNRILEIFPKAKTKTIHQKIYFVGIKIFDSHFASPHTPESYTVQGLDTGIVDSPLPPLCLPTDSHLTPPLTHTHPNNCQPHDYLHDQVDFESAQSKKSTDSVENQAKNQNDSNLSKNQEAKGGVKGEATWEAKWEAKGRQKGSQQKAESTNKTNTFEDQWEARGEKEGSQKKSSDLPESIALFGGVTSFKTRDVIYAICGVLKNKGIVGKQAISDYLKEEYGVSTFGSLYEHGYLEKLAISLGVIEVIKKPKSATTNDNA